MLASFEMKTCPLTWLKTTLSVGLMPTFFLKFTGIVICPLLVTVDVCIVLTFY